MKRPLKIALIILASILGLAVISIVGIRIYYNDSRLKILIEEMAGEEFGGKAVIGSFDIYGFLNIELRDLEIKDKTGDSIWLRVKEVEARIKPAAILKGDLYISEVMVEDAYINYALLPEFQTKGAEGDKLPSRMELPLDLTINRLELRNFVISGPEAELCLDFTLSDVSFSDQDDFYVIYALATDKGQVHYSFGDYSLKGSCEISASGILSSSDSCSQEMSLILSDLEISAVDSFSIDDMEATISTILNLRENQAVIKELAFKIGSSDLIRFAGEIDLKESPRLLLQAEKKDWNIEPLNSFLESVNIPVCLSGSAGVEELRLRGSLSGFACDFTLNLMDIGINYDNSILLGGLDGSIYSDVENDRFIFGSSLSADSVSGFGAAGRLFSIYGISSAVESEFSKSDMNLNITTGTSDFFGGKFDIFAFSESSKIDAELRIDNLSLSRAISNLFSEEGIEVGGIFDLLIKISGNLDSIQSDISANMEDLKVKFEGDSVYVPVQDIKFSGLTKVSKECINCDFTYNFSEGISGEGRFWYPLKWTPRDSMIMSYNLSVDNSALPSYFPAAILEALGAIEVTGKSVMDGRFASPMDTISFTGSSRLEIEPTDILIDNFQSVLYNLISVSEIRVTEKGISIISKSGIEDLFNENYSGLDLAGITIDGEIISLSDTTYRITNMNIHVPSLKLDISVLGDFGYSGGAPFSNVRIFFETKSNESMEIAGGYYFRGGFSAELNVSNHDTLFEYSGKASFKEMEIGSKGIFRYSGITGSIPFSGQINLADSMFVVQSDMRELSGSRYQRARSAELSSNEFGRLTIGQIELDPIYIFNIRADAGFRDGVFEIPYFTGDLLGGNFYGTVKADLSEVNLMRQIPNYEALRYQIDLELSGLDFNQLKYDLGPFKDRADLGADAHFMGTGIIAPGEVYSITGAFHITRMGPGVAERVLDILDPENANPTIVQTKALLNKKLLGFIDMSYKPKNFSFELKHGSLYPRLFMDQPFYADLLPLAKIHMPVEYGRIPVKSLLANLKEESW